MIIPITGNVSYPITLDPSVWIFDDRKILLNEAFNPKFKRENEQDEAKQTAERLNQAYHQKVRPPVNKSINKFERDKVLKNSYVMPLEEFIEHAEPNTSSTTVTLKTKSGNESISLEQLKKSLLLFSIKGKPLTDDGPVHLLFHDGSNKQSPIKGVLEIKIN